MTALDAAFVKASVERRINGQVPPVCGEVLLFIVEITALMSDREWHLFQIGSLSGILGVSPVDIRRSFNLLQELGLIDLKRADGKRYSVRMTGQLAHDLADVIAKLRQPDENDAFEAAVPLSRRAAVRRMH